MKTDLTAIEDTLAGLTDIELHALKVASNEVPQIATGLLAWIEGACDWELNRRPGFDYTLPSIFWEKHRLGERQRCTGGSRRRSATHPRAREHRQPQFA